MKGNSIGIRSVAIVGPYLSGKTTLLESLLWVTKAVSRKGTVQDKNTVGDSSQEARDRQMTVEVNAAHTVYEDVRFTFLDCPGSVEFAQETLNALIGVDAVVVVCEPVVDRVMTLSPLFKFLDDWEIPHFVFLNKMDRADVDFMEVLHALKAVSSRPLIPHQYPIGRGESILGFINLVNEQAYHYHPGAPADPVPFPNELKEEEQLARMEMLETLANWDDHLLEELLEEIEPPEEEILNDLKMELGADLIVPVFFGCADRDYGVRPLLEALLQETSEPTAIAERRNIKSDAEIAQVLKTYNTQQGGKLSLIRVWQGTITDGMTLNGVRIGGMYRLMGQQQQSINEAHAGEIVALARMEGIKTGDTLSPAEVPALRQPEQIKPVFAMAIQAEKRNDEVKLTGTLAKLLEEDAGLRWEQHGDTHEIILWGQGEIHLQVALDRLRRKYNLPMVTHLPQVPYKETVRKSTNSHGRYKHQTGGHGQFGDVYLDIQPVARGDGFRFGEKIVGGVVPKQYIPGVEMGVREYLTTGPLGFPVVDIAVTLTNGSYHSVDSSEQAFKQAARIAMQEGMAKCEPVLLEPIVKAVISVPTDFTSKVLRLSSGRRGQVLGYDAKEGWTGWDDVVVLLPQAEMHDLIVELRSQTMGVGFFQCEFDHLQEVPDKLAERVLVTTGHSNGKR
ncbi:MULTISPECIES: elongation factor G [Leptolyngbya]|jgi:elongation factor G|uniref:Small GTP-binding protein n=1 Tax=Leptolyngbya boryana NIES-2135 TaxID=1973484 RepID=A0A1Z4JEC7_LEPBY|nr:MULTISPECIES: elongation factor G [Leptolyngbya]BAY55135.1 small GTP-binding protein [Leptolyngbya boryana NIES-2135]MBD2369224.1 elongation factor G [Leptolyngbya sp. FACHB-161]MBD2375774.1 elongation factor G [Leptolyngbya sp. FACHB-238]MBD2401123.1 elongation factor G [Leptolyngbya sp. FACHB-239]MBD2406708.1 elongation factor G [Leptolyngbya sp. FACHB-402]